MRSAMIRQRAVVLAVAGLLCACSAGPDYKRPELAMPTAWKLEQPWREARPQDHAPTGNWWEVYADAELSRLQSEALAQSPTLALAAARLAQAQAVLAGANAALYPQLAANLRAQRAGISANRPLTNYNTPNAATTQNDFIPQLQVSYEADLVGRVRRSVEGARASSEQSAADFRNVRLLLTADVATAYFSLRSVDVELDVVQRAIALQRRALGLASDRHQLGAASGIDLAQQQALLDSTLTQVDVLRRQRAQFEHALATLIGRPAPSFSLAPSVQAMKPPAIPVGLPSDLLERRPDIAAAERAMAAANAQVGLTAAAFYPSLTLGGNVGYESRSLTSLFDAPSMVWSLGASLAAPIFDGGRLRANEQAARAGYEASVASYRRTVLSAMQEVEDGLIGGAALERAHTQAGVAIASASRVLDLANTRYEGGVSTYLDVITAQQSLLNAERQAAQLQGQRMLLSVLLVKALGGAVAQ